MEAGDGDGTGAPATKEKLSDSTTGGVAGKENEAKGAAASKMAAREKATDPKTLLENFDFGPILGEGRFGSVVYGRFKSSASSSVSSVTHDNGCYAVKIMEKSLVVRQNQIRQAMNEKRLLSSLRSDLIVRLFLTFHDEHRLYFVLELCEGGTLDDLVRWCAASRPSNESRDVEMRTAAMDVAWVRYYSGQILLALEYLHGHGVVHRDLKPVNIMLTGRGFLKLTDFGSALDTTDTDAPNTFVGTADYVSPEVIKGQAQVTVGVDLWSYGCIIHYMLLGASPFHSQNDHLAMKRVMDHASGVAPLWFPPFIPEEAVDLIVGLLVLDPQSRIGFSDHFYWQQQMCSCEVEDGLRYKSIRSRSFFASGGMEMAQTKDEPVSFWEDLDGGKICPPCTPPKPEWLRKLDAGVREETPLRNGGDGFLDFG